MSNYNIKKSTIDRSNIDRSNMDSSNMDQYNVLKKCKRMIKYILMGFIILVSVRYIPNQPIETKEIIMVASIASIAFAMLDMVSPSVTVIKNT